MFCKLRIFTFTRPGMPAMGSKLDLFESFREAWVGGRWNIRKRSFEFPSPRPLPTLDSLHSQAIPA